MVFPKNLKEIYTKIEHSLREAGIIAGKSGRHMKFPYTISAKIAQFPIFYYMKHNNIWMYYPLGIAVGFYFIAKIHAMSNSEENKRNWAETQRKAAEKEKHN
ncbi:unnamed protein product [Parnassius mnemosyne]|uniref:Small integral membrane protein 8 n=1 Tax=Parnassius mnemosyne TaxID=213953 RepID=A0AAV1KIZ7_9NEOP